MNRLKAELVYRRAKRHQEYENRDACDPSLVTLPGVAVDEARDPHPEWGRLQSAEVGESIIGNGQVIADIPGMGKVYDWHDSPWTPSNGGRINPLIFVDHIPVIPQMAGIADFIRLRDVLVARGLMVQSATDGEGNVAIFTRLDQLCYQAKGANQVSCGCEHMHALTSDPWNRLQLNAASYIHWRAREYQGIPSQKRARLGSGNGIVRVFDEGYTTHEEVSAKAGYFDRSDPGQLFEDKYERIERGVLYFDEHRHFRGF